MGFIIAATLLVVAVMVILLWPLWRAPRFADAVNRQAANLDIFRDQLRELERDRHQGLLAETDFEQAKNELHRRLLEDTQSQAVIPRIRGGRKTALALLIVVPLTAVAGYALLGNTRAFDPLETQARVSPQQIEDMVGKLVDKLKQNPDDTKGWVMLARSYKVMGRYAKSADAYSHGGTLVNSDPSLLADYAEVLGQVNGGNLEGKPLELIAQALKMDPNEPQALFLAGSAATDRNDFPAVFDYWERLLLQLEPGSEEAKSLQAAVDKARKIVTKNGGQSVQKTATEVRASTSAGAEMISGEVGLSGKIAAQAKPDDLLFVFARAEEGPRMPLAVMRVRVSDLPLKFSFNDSMALPGGKKISEFKTVSVEARVAKAGQAQSSSGDLFGSLKGVKPGSRNVRVLIDQVEP
jgi:cytochrome c-type biogenesis protein CcmH